MMLVRTVAFSARVRQWRDDKPGGLAVVDIPAALVPDLGGRRQMRVTGNLNGTPFTGSTMLVAGGGLCVSVSKAALKAANAAVGDEVVYPSGQHESCTWQSRLSRCPGTISEPGKQHPCMENLKRP
jgi:Domain of unknown function (DUF1905)